MIAAPTGQDRQHIASVATDLGARRSAFTLVELLVVIGIITILISILLPVLSRAREQARTIKCQSNMRQVVQAMLTYADTHKGTLPLFTDGAQRFGYAGVVSGGYALYDYSQGSMMPYISPSPQVRMGVFTCPSDDYSRFGGYATGNFSYNFSDILFSTTSGSSNGLLWALKVSRIVHSPNKILVLEQENPVQPNGTVEQYQSYMQAGKFLQYTQYMLTTRHQGWANEGFADGHVGILRASDFPDMLTPEGQAAYGKYITLTSDNFRQRP